MVRIAIFTDTVADVNGVSRFIGDTAREAIRAGSDVHILCSTPFQPPALANIVNFRPLCSTAMPSYPQLALAIPPMMEMWRYARELNPDAVHVSTPGPVGTIGRMFALCRKLPLLGTYHTDFPEYVQRLIGKESLTRVCEAFMARFYKPFDRVFTRSAEYERSLHAMGIDHEKIVRLHAGIDLSRFGPDRRDTTVFERAGAEPAEVRALYVGRVSVEKGLPLIASVWPWVVRELSIRGIRARLVVVGDGPYRTRMQEALKDHATDFLGFRHNEELAAMYASADVFLFPSVTDTLGQVVIEAQASGLPVLVTDQGGPQSVIVHGETGFAIPTADLVGWRRATVELLSDSISRRAFGFRASEHAKRFDFRKSFEAFIAAHEAALSAYHRT